MHTSSRVVCIIFWCNAVLLLGDFKVVALLVGLQQGYKKYVIFLTCIWVGRPSKGIKLLAEGLDSQTKCSSSRKEYPAPSSDEPTKSCYHPFTSGLMKNFVKAMDRTLSAFRYLHETFPWLSKAKSKERVFVDPQIHFLRSNLDFFSDNCTMVISDERFCKYIGTMEQRYNWNGPLQCWLTTLAGHSRDVPEQLYKRQVKKSKK